MAQIIDGVTWNDAMEIITSKITK